MDTLLRYLPIAVVVLLAFLVNPFQADAQLYENPAPARYQYQSGNINDTYTTNLANHQFPSVFQFNRWWALAILLVPVGYFLWKKAQTISPFAEPVGRGYQIVYQDIRRSKKRTFKTVRRAKAL